jgi:hypothetical protein
VIRGWHALYIGGALLRPAADQCDVQARLRAAPRSASCRLVVIPTPSVWLTSRSLEIATRYARRVYPLTAPVRAVT